MKLTNEKARRAAMMAIDQLASEEDKMAERAIKGYIEHLEMELMKMYSKYTTSEARSVLLVDETKRLRTELATMKADTAPANEAPAVDAEPIKEGDKVRWTSNNKMYEGETGVVSVAEEDKVWVLVRPSNGGEVRGAMRDSLEKL